MIEDIINFIINFVYKIYLIAKFIILKLYVAVKWILFTAVKEFIKQFFRFVFRIFFRSMWFYVRDVKMILKWLFIKHARIKSKKDRAN